MSFAGNNPGNISVGRFASRFGGVFGFRSANLGGMDRCSPNAECDAHDDKRRTPRDVGGGETGKFTGRPEIFGSFRDSDLFFRRKNKCPQM